jgi:hypothetical protein
MTGKPEVETDGLGEATMILSGETEAGSEGAREERGRYHAVEEEGVPLREIAQAIGRGLEMPVVSLSPHKVAEHVVATAISDLQPDCPGLMPWRARYSCISESPERPGWQFLSKKEGCACAKRESVTRNSCVSSRPSVPSWLRRAFSFRLL